MSGWISVDDSLPQIDELVLVMRDNQLRGEFYQKLLFPNLPRYQVFPARMVEIDEEGYERWIAIESSSYMFEYVTHWMPLPKTFEGTYDYNS